MGAYMRLLEAHIEVSDLQRSLNFYSTLLPHKKIVNWSDHSAAALVLHDGSAFGLWKISKTGLHGGKGAQHLHYAFQITPGEYQTYKKRLESLSVDVVEHEWPSGHRSLYFFDPDGHQGEFMTCDWFVLNRRDENDH
jgi:catechol 2,3-dioxygenase-like lactoylglutathione lyase family enzyme